MKFNPCKCPECGAPPKGTLETVPGLALLAEPDEHGEFEYEGETEIFWNAQKTDRDDDGRVTLECTNGHAWQAERVDWPGSHKRRG